MQYQAKPIYKNSPTKAADNSFEASNYTTLSDSLKSIINLISGEVDDFSGITVNIKSSSFSSDNRAFINLFTPSEKRAWDGNVKGYFLEGSGLKDTNGVDILDANGKILPAAQSFWSTSADGGIITEGGLSQKLRSGGRILYTYTGASDPVNVNLSTSSETHRILTANTALTAGLLAVPNETARTELLNWVQTAPMTDPLHAKPVVANYASGEVLFTMTNQGFLACC